MAASLTKDTSEPVPQTVLEGEIQSRRFEHLGLGRGVNAKDPKPWLNRSSFQVRAVTKNNIIATDEGGAVQSHDMEIHSSFALQTELQASITAPQTPITIGVDAELSRRVSTWYKTVGEKVLNRSISFRTTFEDSVPYKEPEQGAGTTSAITTVEYSTFEDRLCEWVLHHMECDDECEEDQTIIEREKVSGKSNAEILLSLLDSESKGSKIHTAFQNACREFNDTFNITHYVSTIRLGAVRYDSRTVRKSCMRSITKSSFGVATTGGGSASTKVTFRKSSKHLKSKTIGRISDDDTVKKGTSDEAVVEVKLTPITTLIKFTKLRQYFEIELMEYTANSPGGPYYIATFNKDKPPSSTTDRKPMLLGIHNDELHATTDNKMASLFFVSSTNDPSHPDEFRITQKPNLTELEKQCKMDSFSLYLDTPVKVSGRCHGPLKFKKHVKERDSRFVLVSRVGKGSDPVSTAPWKAHRDIFFIKCARRGLSRHSFLAIRRNRDGAEQQQLEDRTEQQQIEDPQGHGQRNECGCRWESCCVNSVEKEDRDDCSMLFRLLPQHAFSRTKTKLSDQQPDSAKKASGEEEVGAATTDQDKTLASAEGNNVVILKHYNSKPEQPL